MKFFNYAELTNYLFSIRFEIVLAIETEAKREKHPPSRRIYRRDLLEHDMTIRAIAQHAIEAGQASSFDPGVRAFLKKLADIGLGTDSVEAIEHQRFEGYYGTMYRYDIDWHEKRYLQGDDCFRCGHHVIPYRKSLCKCSYEERQAAIMRAMETIRAEKKAT